MRSSEPMTFREGRGGSCAEVGELGVVWLWLLRDFLRSACEEDCCR